MRNFGSILKVSHKNLVVRRTTRPQIVVVLTYFLVAEDTRTLEFCYLHTVIFGQNIGRLLVSNDHFDRTGAILFRFYLGEGGLKFRE